jgi:hypothetical protein
LTQNAAAPSAACDLNSETDSVCIRQSDKREENPLLYKTDDLFASAEITKSEPALGDVHAGEHVNGYKNHDCPAVTSIHQAQTVQGENDDDF